MKTASLSDETAFREALTEGKARIDAALVDALDRRFGVERDGSVLYKAARHALLSGGKRLRPLLIVKTCELFHDDPSRALYAAVAMEFIHTYSLIHDDLPAMDDAALRRGHPTVHTLYGDGMAVLAGDALLTEALVLLAEGPENGDVSATVLLEVLRLMAEAAGVRGMVYGQEMDLRGEGRRISLDELKKLHRHKTGALLRASVDVGALLGGADAADRERLVRYGEAIGLAFQIRDDLLDIEGDPVLLGKDGSDLKNEKSTYPALLGLEGSRKAMHNLIDEAVNLLEPFGEQAVFLSDLARYIGARIA